jgi:hypothetical protein
MSLLTFFDVAPDPVRSGAALGVALVVIAFVILLVGAAALVFFLWYHKRSRRVQEMIRPEYSPTTGPVQANSPNQP